MARIRSVKPEFWADEDLADVSRDARLLYIGLWNLADEHGRLRGDPRYVKGQLFPYDDDLTATSVDELLTSLEAAGKLVRYRVDTGRYLFLPNLGKHQRLEADKVPSKLPTPPDPDEYARRADLSAPIVGEDDGDEPQASEQEEHSAQTGADKSAPGADESSLLYVAGSMEQGAGSMSGAPAPSAAKPRRSATTDADPGFDRFWAVYPRREGKKDAQRAWPNAVKAARGVDAIITAAERYRDSRRGQDSKYTKTPAAWLNGERWNDEPSRASPASVNGHQPYRDPADPSVYYGDL